MLKIINPTTIKLPPIAKYTFKINSTNLFIKLFLFSFESTFCFILLLLFSFSAISISSNKAFDIITGAVGKRTNFNNRKIAFTI